MATKTERITVRVTKHHLDIIDALVAVGEIENRSYAIRRAIKDFVEKNTPQAAELVAKQKAQASLKQLAAQVSEFKEYQEQ